MAQTAAEKQRRYRERLKAKAAGLLPDAPALANVPPVKRWQAMQANAAALLVRMRDELQGYYDERSDAWLESEKADAMQGRIDALDAAIDALEGLDW